LERFWESPAYLWPGHATRAATFENPTAEPGGGNLGRKERPNKLLDPGERVVLADLEGPGTVTHVWATVGAPYPNDATSEFLRRQTLEVFYGDRTEPSISVPVPDFFGAVHGVPVSYASALTAINENRGFTNRIPMPFRDRIRLEYRNADERHALLYYHADVLLGPVDDDAGILHAAFRRENPTELGRDFVVTEGLHGPGRFLGWTGGVRVLDGKHWWGEGEVKMFFDGEKTPTICGTGTEDYLDSAWGLGPFTAPESGAPLVVASGEADVRTGHRLVGFYRWHLSDPVVFERDLKVTVQQIGFRWKGGYYDRQDDWCATAFTYCSGVQAVPRMETQ